MAKLTVVIGLAGSGKSRHCRSLAGPGGRVYEDFLARPHDFFEDTGLMAVLMELHAGRDCIANENGLHTQARRDRLERVVKSLVPGAEVEWVCFENDPEACRDNVEADGRDGIRSDVEARKQWIGKRAKEYTYPQGVRPIPVTRKAP